MSVPDVIRQFIDQTPFALQLYAEDLSGGHDTLDHHGGRRVPAASTIKIPILAALAERMDRGLDDWQQPVDLAQHQLDTPGSGVLARFKEPVRISLYNLAVLMMIVSDNAATNWLIEHVGYDAVNGICRKHGCSDTELNRPMRGRPAQGGEKENLTTMVDQARFYKLMVTGDLVSRPASDAMLGILKGQQLSNRIPRYLPELGEFTAAHKTGTIAGACLDAGLVWLPDREEPFVIAVSANDWERRPAAEDAVARLAFYAVRALREN